MNIEKRELKDMFKEQSEEYLRQMNVVLEQYQSANRVGYEILNGKIDGVVDRLDKLEEKFDSLEVKVDVLGEKVECLEIKADSVYEMVGKNTEDIAELKDSLGVKVR